MLHKLSFFSTGGNFWLCDLEAAAIQHIEDAWGSPKQKDTSRGREFQSVYTTWKVDGATPMYWFIMAPC